MLAVPVLASPLRARDLPYAVEPLVDGDVIEAGDVPLRVVATPGPSVDHLAFVVDDGRFVVAGDLDGRRGARAIPGPIDRPAWDASVARLRREASNARWLPGHPD